MLNPIGLLVSFVIFSLEMAHAQKVPPVSVGAVASIDLTLSPNRKNLCPLSTPFGNLRATHQSKTPPSLWGCNDFTCLTINPGTVAPSLASYPAQQGYTTVRFEGMCFCGKISPFTRYKYPAWFCTYSHDSGPPGSAD